MKNNLSAVKFSRTLKQAFGPYSEWHIDRRTWIEKNFIKLVVVAAAPLILILVLK